MIAETEQLEAKGFYQETYNALDARFTDWNYGVWQHRWKIAKGACALCASPAVGIAVEATLICLACLSEYPHTSWHPTGAVVPKMTVFLSHAASCAQHSAS